MLKPVVSVGTVQLSEHTLAVLAIDRPDVFGGELVDERDRLCGHDDLRALLRLTKACLRAQ